MTTTDIELENDEVAALGESFFRTGCIQNQIAAIKAEPDKYGWDFILQFAGPHGPHEAPERSCKVQVKTTTSDAVSVAPSRVPQVVVNEVHSVAKEADTARPAIFLGSTSDMTDIDQRSFTARRRTFMA
jgi:hypothetical protein